MDYEDEFDDLFDRKTGSDGTWYGGLTDEQREWVHALAAKSKARGKLPVGGRSAEKFVKRFGGKPPARETIVSTVKRINGDD